MTTAEVNAAVAKAKGWKPRKSNQCPNYKWVEFDAFHENPTDDPCEWSRLLEELMNEHSGVVLRRYCKFFVIHVAPDIHIEQLSLGEAVCRAWLRWKGVSDA